jgi:hypothetical protein
MRVSFIVTVENLSSKATGLTLADRIPVSENREIKVSNVKITPAGNPDSKGILHWDLKLKPKEKRQFRISYQVDYPRALIIDARRKRAAKPAMPAVSPFEGAQPAPAADFDDYEIQDQLMDLEEML